MCRHSKPRFLVFISLSPLIASSPLCSAFLSTEGDGEYFGLKPSRYLFVWISHKFSALKWGTVPLALSIWNGLTHLKTGIQMLKWISLLFTMSPSPYMMVTFSFVIWFLKGRQNKEYQTQGLLFCNEKVAFENVTSISLSSPIRKQRYCHCIFKSKMDCCRKRLFELEVWLLVENNFWSGTSPYGFSLCERNLEKTEVRRTFFLVGTLNDYSMKKHKENSM